MTLERVLSDSPNIDRPDITKEQANPILEFKEVKGALFKFLMISGIKFSGVERLYIKTKHKLKTNKEGEPPKFLNSIKISKKEIDPYDIKNKYENGDITYRQAVNKLNKKPEFFYEVTTNSYYSVTCKLLDISVGGKPVYIIVLSKSFSELDNRQKNKLIYLMKTYNIIIFDEEDWKEIGLDISNKKWLKPLSKNILKKWAKKLFKKLTYLEGEVKSYFTLNDLNKSIDKRVNNEKLITSKLEKLRKENLKLRSVLLKNEFSKKFKVKKDHLLILEQLASLDSKSIIWIESVINKIISSINNINVKNKYYSSFFTQKNGKVNLVNKEALCDLTVKEFNKFINLEIKHEKNGIILIKNLKTLQNVLVCVTCGSLNTKFKFDVPKDINENLIFHLHCQCGKKSVKFSNILGYLAVKNYSSSSNFYNSSFRVPIYNYTKDKIYKFNKELF